MFENTSNLLLLTVGVGTAGIYSSIADGLRRTVELLKPRRFWLVPSLANDSQAIAELVAEGLANFTWMSGTERYWPLPDADDLESCRTRLRLCIAAVRQELRPGERLLVNPTSGTKQMTTAAVLAALDEQIGDIIFTSGERVEGTVKTGTERIVPFEAAFYFRERDFNSANELFVAGSFYAAIHLLSPHKNDLRKAWATASMCYYWQRFDYGKAASIAAGLHETHRRAFSRREQRLKAGKPAPEILADILSWARYALTHQDPDESLRLSYKAIEYAGKCRLAEMHDFIPDQNGLYNPENLYVLHPDFEGKFRGFARPGLALGLRHLMSILATLGDPMGHNFSNDRLRVALARTRNENIHAIRPVKVEEAQALLESATALVEPFFLMEPIDIPSALPHE